MPRAKQGYAEHLPLKRQLRSRMTGAEIRLWSRLRGKQFESMKFRRQHGIGPYIVDFYCPERAVVIEVDGDNHAETRQMIKDREREGYIRALGLRIIRYTNDDVLTNLEGVMEYLVKELAEQSTSPGPSLSRGGADRSSLRSSP